MNIKITGGQSDRLEILGQLLDDKDEWEVSLVHLEGIEEHKLKSEFGKPTVIIADLAYVDGPAPKFINLLKDLFPDSKLIGLHFYRNLKLINPLVHAGLDGYVHSNARKYIFYDAIVDVIGGDTFILERDQ
jgi:DNA-binding NarL/FixJ family response regulator